MRTFVFALVVAFAVSACAPKLVPTPVVTAPKFPEFTQPGLPPAFAGAPVAEYLTRGWAFLQAGDLKTAEREFSIALTAAPAFYPAETSSVTSSSREKTPTRAPTSIGRSNASSTSIRAARARRG
jgi:hypothetical protein